MLESSLSSRTTVSGRIYGGGTTGVHGGVASTASIQGKIESETTEYQTILLKDNDGVEHIIKTVDMTIPTRAGHRLTLWRMGKDRWKRALNNSTEEDYTSERLDKVLFPKIFYFVFGFFFASWAMGDAGTSGGEFGIFFLMYWLVGLVVGLLPCYIVAGFRRRTLFKAIDKNSQQVPT